MNAQGQGKDKLVLISGIFLLIPFVIGLSYIENVMSVAMVISILEIDVYGWKAQGKSMKLIRGKICVSFVVFLPLHIAIAGLVFAFTSLLVQEFVSLSIMRSFYVTIACSLLLMVLIHFTLVIQTIVYFVCKSYHNEDLSNFAENLGDGYANLGGEQGDNELHRPLV
ncbi:hypothetical protein MKW98_001539 [Papaver atlanticum]|uniref:Uncharacterized protein n=1 Tax=Papaver atlanticum TaxID=357466 RepID=A0AAD4XAU2_9MAGN|nr:hypothetical protein MKW98_001539 [Papaver atlanticum]